MLLMRVLRGSVLCARRCSSEECASPRVSGGDVLLMRVLRGSVLCATLQLRGVCQSEGKWRGCAIDESIERFRAVCEAAAQRSVPVRG